MKSSDETYMAAGVLLAAALLLALVVIGPRGYSSAVGSLKTATTTLPAHGPEPTTTTVAEPATTHTTAAAPTTTEEATTTSTGSSTSTTTSTTLPIKCRTNMDCGGIVSTLKCGANTNTVYNHTSYFSCMRGAEGGTYCEEKRKIAPLRACEEWEKCKNGICLPVWDNQCDYECYQQGFEDYYCRDGECRTGDEKIALDKPCNRYGLNCCCKAGSD